MTILTKNIIIVIIGGEIIPRALTEQEKFRQHTKLLERGKSCVFSQGIKKVSVDDISKAAGMAKGSFYQHFESKEKYLFELIWSIHEQLFARVEKMLLDKSNLKANIRGFLMNICNEPETTFFIKNYREINELFDNKMSQELQSAKQTEAYVYERMLILAGIDIQKVKPGVVHNYIHMLFSMMGSDLMIKENLSETFELMLDGLIFYIFGGVS